MRHALGHGVLRALLLLVGLGSVPGGGLGGARTLLAHLEALRHLAQPPLEAFLERHQTAPLGLIGGLQVIVAPIHLAQSDELALGLQSAPLDLPELLRQHLDLPAEHLFRRPAAARRLRTAARRWLRGAPLRRNPPTSAEGGVGGVDGVEGGSGGVGGGSLRGRRG